MTDIYQWYLTEIYNLLMVDSISVIPTEDNNLAISHNEKFLYSIHSFWTQKET